MSYPQAGDSGANGTGGLNLRCFRLERSWEVKAELQWWGLLLPGLSLHGSYRSVRTSTERVRRSSIEVTSAPLLSNRLAEPPVTKQRGWTESFSHSYLNLFIVWFPHGSRLLRDGATWAKPLPSLDHNGRATHDKATPSLSQTLHRSPCTLGQGAWGVEFLRPMHTNTAWIYFSQTHGYVLLYCVSPCFEAGNSLDTTLLHWFLWDLVSKNSCRSLFSSGSCSQKEKGRSSETVVLSFCYYLVYYHST